MQASSRLLTSSNTGALPTLGLGPRRSISPHSVQRSANLNCRPALDPYFSVTPLKPSPLPQVGSLPNALLTPFNRRLRSRPRSSRRCRSTRHGYASSSLLTGRLPSLSLVRRQQATVFDSLLDHYAQAPDDSAPLRILFHNLLATYLSPEATLHIMQGN